MPGPDYTIFAATDLAMCTSSGDGGTSFLEAYAPGSRLRPGGEESSLDESSVSDYGFEDFIRSMDIILCGRGTYDQIMHYSAGKWPYPQKRLIVFTVTPLTEPSPQRPDSGEFYRLRESLFIVHLCKLLGRSSTFTSPASSNS